MEILLQVNELRNTLDSLPARLIKGADLQDTYLETCLTVMPREKRAIVLSSYLLLPEGYI